MEQTSGSTLERCTEETESEAEPNSENTLHVPDGGWGWVVCFAGFMINSTSGGLNVANGILLLGLLDLYGDKISKTAMVGSIFGGIMLCVGPFVLLMMMFNASHRQVIICGGFVSALSTLASFFAPNVEVLYVTYGILSGTFVGISYFAGNIIVGCYFKKKRTVAVGIAQSGTGVGAFALNYLLERSIFFYGMRGTFLLISGLLLNFLVYGALCRPLKIVNAKKKRKEIKLKSVNGVPLKPNSEVDPKEKTTEYETDTNTNNSGNSEHLGHLEENPPTDSTNKLKSKCTYLHKILFDPGVMKNPGMQLLLIIYLFWTAGECVILYLPAKAVTVGLTREQGALTMSIYGAVFMLSQIVVGILADLIRIPQSYLLMSSLLGMAATSFAFTFCHSFPWFVLCTSLFAICHACGLLSTSSFFNSSSVCVVGFTFPLRVVLVSSILGVRNLTKGYSPLCLMVGLTYIIDTIITGYLLDATQSFDAVFYLISGSLFIACIISSRMIYIQLKGKFCE